ncbi:hypothetical protein [Streptomyces sp. NPDC087294]|uniref:hypothetical protein n=1 Tax=Streptomyces sp. NPDC087294 TaxID=3365777 RepID=UPI00382E2B6F
MNPKSRPLPDSTIRPPYEETPPVSRGRRRLRRDAARHVLRGICYGAGTGLAGLAFWWLEQHL